MHTTREIAHQSSTLPALQQAEKALSHTDRPSVTLNSGKHPTSRTPRGVGGFQGLNQQACYYYKTTRHIFFENNELLFLTAST